MRLEFRHPLGFTTAFWARVAHAGIYIAGIPYIRAVAVVASLNALFGIASEVLGA